LLIDTSLGDIGGVDIGGLAVRRQAAGACPRQR